MQNDIARLLIDPETGQLKSFDKWRRDIKGITDHYETDWLQTEYNTAVIRAHQAADWKHFQEEADVFPNVRWMPTTSITPDPLHERYWQLKLTLPVNHPFWDEHHPGDRWNCKCTLLQTDDPVNAEALDGWTPPLPMPGLDNNPAKDGKIFSDTHPYVTEAYPGAKEAVKKVVKDVSGKFKATTVEEAKRFIIDNIADSVDFDFKKTDLDNLNPILNQLKARMDLYKLPKFRTFKKSVERNADASVSRDGKEFSLSTAFLRTPDKIYEKLEKFEKKYGYRFRAVADRDDYVRATIDHELGHVIASKYNLSRGDLDRAFSKDLRNALGYYATTSPDEYWAECVAAYFGPLRKEMTKIELDLVEGFFKQKGINIASVTKKAKQSPSSLRRTEEEKKRILKEWEDRKKVKDNENKVAQLLKMKVPSKTMTFDQADGNRSNPKFLEAKQYQVNCQSCVVSHELRMRGWDVEAIGNTKRANSLPRRLSYATQQAWIDRETNAAPVRIEKKDFDEFYESASEVGRYHVRWTWKNYRSGHIITFERTKDGGLFYDPQSGKKYTLDEIKSKWGDRINEGSVAYYRVDNLNVNPNFVGVVKKKAKPRTAKKPTP